MKIERDLKEIGLTEKIIIVNQELQTLEIVYPINYDLIENKYNNDYTEYLISEHEYNESNCNYMVIEKLKIVNRSDKTAICFDK